MHFFLIRDVFVVVCLCMHEYICVGKISVLVSTKTSSIEE